MFVPAYIYHKDTGEVFSLAVVWPPVMQDYHGADYIIAMTSDGTMDYVRLSDVVFGKFSFEDTSLDMWSEVVKWPHTVAAG